MDKTHELEKMCAGSWVYGSFSTWIGEPDKNRAWDRLIEAKQAYDKVLEASNLNEKEAEIATRQLAICEGSDWFWWFGEHNSSESVNDFDRLFRTQLKNLYRLLKLQIPDNLDEPLSKVAVVQRMLAPWSEILHKLKYRINNDIPRPSTKARRYPVAPDITVQYTLW